MDDLDSAAVKVLISNWHDAVLEHPHDEEERLELQSYKEQLPAQLNDPTNRRVRDLCRNPLLCAMVCALNWNRQGDLPQKRVELYDECCDALIHTRDERRKIRTGEGGVERLTHEDKHLLLQRLAWNMLCNRVDHAADGQHWEVSRSDAESWISPHMSRLKEPASFTAAQVIDYLVERTSLIRIPARGRIDFPHRTFQEYLAACAAGAENQYGHLANQAHDDQWRETIILASGTRFGGVPFGGQLIKTLVEKGQSNSVPRSVKAACIALALACCETAQQVTPELKQRVLAHLNVIAPPDTLEMADMLAAGGDAVLPWLEYRKLPNKSVGCVAAAARTLARIGTEQAARMLIDPKGYGSDDRATVVAEACSCALVHPADFAHVIKGKSETAKRLLSVAVFDSSRVLTESSVSRLRGVFDADLSRKQLTDISRIYLIPNVTRLSIAYNPLRDLSPLTLLPKLRSLDVSGLTKAALDTLPVLPNVKSLSFIYYMKDSISIRECVISKLLNLTALYISHSQVLDFEAVLALSYLKYLTLLWCPPESLAAASSHPTLQHFTVSADQMQMVADLLKTETNFPALQSLRIVNGKKWELLKEIQALRPNLDAHFVDW